MHVTDSAASRAKSRLAGRGSCSRRPQSAACVTLSIVVVHVAGRVPLRALGALPAFPQCLRALHSRSARAAT